MKSVSTSAKRGESGEYKILSIDNYLELSRVLYRYNNPHVSGFPGDVFKFVEDYSICLLNVCQLAVTR